MSMPLEMAQQLQAQASALVAALTLPSPPPSSAKIVGLNSPFESSFGGVQDWYIKDAAALGCRAIRAECWTGPEAKGKHERLARNGIGMLPLVNNYGVDPTNLSAWVQAAKEAAPYADLGVLEIGNESYWPFYGRPGNPEARPGDWARMWAAVASALPQMKLIVPVGLQAEHIVDWIPGCKAAVPDVFQKVRVAVHPYGALDSTRAQWHYGAWLAIAELLPGVPQWWTEIGQKVTAVGAEGQAQAAARYCQDVKASPLVEAIFWFNHRDWSPPDPTKDNGWALLDENGNRRPAWAAYQAGARLLGA